MKLTRGSAIIALTLIWIGAIYDTIMSLSRGTVVDAYIAGFITATIMMATIVFIAGEAKRDE